MNITIAWVYNKREEILNYQNGGEEIKTLIIGHRGAMGSAPENTAVSFKQALAAGADGVELDLHLTRDRQPVVIHDQSVDRTTDGKGLIKDLTLKEVKQLDAGGKFGLSFAREEILTLAETLELVKQAKVINIELKSGPIIYDGIEEMVLAEIKNFGLESRVLISSFNHYSIVKVKGLAPGIKCGLLYMAGLYQPWLYAKTVAAEAIHPYYPGVLPPIVEGCREAGIELNVFGANREEELTRLLKLGVNMIITDYPDRALRLREQICTGGG